MQHDLALVIILWGIAIGALPLAISYYRRTRINRVLKWSMLVAVLPLVLIALASLLMGDIGVGLGIVAVTIPMLIFNTARGSREASVYRQRAAYWNRRKKGAIERRRQEKQGRTEQQGEHDLNSRSADEAARRQSG